MKNQHDSLRLTIGFGVANALFSTLAYFLIERKKDDTDEEDNIELDLLEESSVMGEVEAQARRQRRRKFPDAPAFVRGRRNLLLWSLAGGAVMLFILTFLLQLPAENNSKKGAVMAFVILFTFFHAPGTGAVPFAYSAEVFPNEWRELGMSSAVLTNFLGKHYMTSRLNASSVSTHYFLSSFKKLLSSMLTYSRSRCPSFMRPSYASMGYIKNLWLIYVSVLFSAHFPWLIVCIAD